MTSLLLSPPTASRTRTTQSPLAFCATRTANRLLAVLIGALLLSLTTPVQAGPADEFLNGLRERGWHDTALDYLNNATEDPLAEPAFLKKRDFERSVTLATLARQAAGEKKRQTLLAKATQSAIKFSQENPESPLQLQALAVTGNLLAEQALYAINKAEKLPKAAKRQRKTLFATARDFLKQAKPPTHSLLELCATKTKTLPKAAELQSNPQAKALRKELLTKQAEAKFLLAKLDFEKARTLADNPKARTKAFGTSAEAFENIYNEYEQTNPNFGYFGRLQQARCYQLSGDLEKALQCYGDLVDQPPIPNKYFRRLVTRAYRHRAECHLINNNAEKVIEECRQWLNEAVGNERKEPDWLALSYMLANAYEKIATSSVGNEAQLPRNESRKLYREVAKLPGEFQLEAKAKLASGRTRSTKPVIAKTFDEAFAAGKDTLQQASSAEQAARLAKENNPDAYEGLREEGVDYRLSARQYFRQSISLADEQTDLEQLATAQYYLAQLLLEDNQFQSAAVVGEFVARRYSESKYAPFAAQTALAAYQRLYIQAKKSADTNTDFESERLASIAELLALRWPESPEAATALNLMMTIALQNDRLADAEAMLERLPPANRATGKLRLGQALYLRSNPKSDSTIALREKANKLLASGFEAIQQNTKVTAAEATGVLYYGQSLLASGKANRAIAVLENATVGPLSLITSQSEVAENLAFKQETYKVALRAYVSTTPPQRDKAMKMMTALEASVLDQGQGQQKLIDTYFNLGLQLQKQIRDLTASSMAQEAEGVAEAFADLLKRVTERASSVDNWKIESWVAQTNLQLGQGLSGKSAQRYYQQATRAYQTLLQKASENPKFAPNPRAVLIARLRLADCQLALQNYDQASKAYITILRERPRSLELQKAVASSLLQSGSQQKDIQQLEDSIRGTMPQANKKNLVWGWLRLAKAANQYKRQADKRPDDPAQQKKSQKYKDLFFEAHLNVITARYEVAKLSTGETRKKHLGSARQVFRSMTRLYPDLGGPRWKDAYQQLMKQMEQEK